jgi:hypothetical protein
VNEVRVVLHLVGGAAVFVICHQIFIHRKLKNIELLLWEVCEVLDAQAQEEVDEKFLDIVERFDDE